MSYHLLRFFFRIMSRLPFSVLYALSGVMYLLLYYVIRYRRKIVRKNLTESFPEKNSNEILGIEKILPLLRRQYSRKFQNVSHVT